MPPNQLDYLKLIGQRLKDWRAGKKWPMKHIASALQVSVPTVSGWERGTHFPSGEHLIRLARLYRTPVCRLLCAGKDVCRNLCPEPDSEARDGAA
jgi:transcriptional regulator with XRE-family HTH domain